MYRFLSWDCANKTLAYIHLTVDTDILKKLKLIVKELNELLSVAISVDFASKFQNAKLQGPDMCIFREKLNDEVFTNLFISIILKLNAQAASFITFHTRGVVDILEGKKVNETDEVQRTIALHNFLINSKVSIDAINAQDNDGIKTQVIIEHQPSRIGMKTNNKSTAIGHQLMFYYITRNVILINPRYKNNIKMNDLLDYETFVASALIKNKTRRDAVYTARKLHSKTSFIYLLKTFGHEGILTGIRKPCLDDLADAFMQVLAFLYVPHPAQMVI
jgi:hypothetical protein